MNDLYSLIQCLTSREWESLQGYLTCFSTHSGDDGGLKQLQLAKVLREGTECPSQTRCSLKVYGERKATGFDMLKSRLKDKILDFISTDICDKSKDIDEIDLAYIQIKKMSAQYQQLFYAKPRLQLTYDLVDEIIFLAKKYEYFLAAAEHLKLKRGLTSWQKSEADFRKINKEIDDNIVKSCLVIKAESYYQDLFISFDFSGRVDKKKVLSFLETAIAEIGKGFIDTNSPIINYYLKYFEMAHATLIENHAKARSICLELLNIVRNNKSVYRRQRIGAVYDNVSRCEFYLNNLEQAAEYAIEAQKLFPANSVNYSTALEQEFYARFGLKQYDQSLSILNKIFTATSRKELHEFRYSKYKFFQANTLFMKRNFSEALAILSDEREIAKDKSGWEIGARVLKIMTLIEMLKLDEAGLAVNSLKQFFKYTEKKTPISERDKKILNLLIIAEKKGFVFTSLNGNTDKYLAALSSNEKELRWEPFTHEVIPFHEWFAGKMGNGKIQKSVSAAGKKTHSATTSGN